MNQKNRQNARAVSQRYSRRWSVGLLLSVFAPTFSLAIAKGNNFNELDLGLSFLTGKMLVGAFRIFTKLKIRFNCSQSKDFQPNS